MHTDIYTFIYLPAWVCMDVSPFQSLLKLVPKKSIFTNQAASIHSPMRLAWSGHKFSGINDLIIGNSHATCNSYYFIIFPVNYVTCVSNSQSM